MVGSIKLRFQQLLKYVTENCLSLLLMDEVSRKNSQNGIFVTPYKA